jgi:WS/DGAT C-terminal domain
VGGGLRSWLGQHHGRLGRVRVKVPVSLHDQRDASNADSFFFVDVPLEHEDPVQRLRAVHAATARRKGEHDAETMDRLLRDLRATSPRLSGLCERIERSPRAFALNVSNVPGPRQPVAVDGARVRSLHSIAEIAEHHAVRVAAVSLCDELFLGFCADPAIVPDVGSMAKATEQDAAQVLTAALASRAR